MPLMLDIGSNQVKLPSLFEKEGWSRETLDINPTTQPNHCLDARYIYSSPSLASRFDCVYLSHVLEHFMPRDIPDVLRGAFHALRNGGFSLIRVPSVELATLTMLDTRSSLDDPIKAYSAESGAVITYRMLINGMDGPFMRHFTHFTLPSLKDWVEEAGFTPFKGAYVEPMYEIILMSSKGELSKENKELLDKLIQ